MDVLIEFGKILLPAGIVLYAMYLTMKSILQKEVEKRLIDYKIENSKIVLPIRLQAFERMCLFLERMMPDHLVLRLNQSNLSAKQFRLVLLNEIREEFNHNLSQQVYMSDRAWGMIRNSVEDMIALVNTCSEKLPDEAKSIELARELFNEIERRGTDPVSGTLSLVKAEIREAF